MGDCREAFVADGCREGSSGERLGALAGGWFDALTGGCHEALDRTGSESAGAMRCSEGIGLRFRKAATALATALPCGWFEALTGGCHEAQDRTGSESAGGAVCSDGVGLRFRKEATALATALG